MIKLLIKNNLGRFLLCILAFILCSGLTRAEPRLYFNAYAPLQYQANGTALGVWASYSFSGSELKWIDASQLNNLLNYQDKWDRVISQSGKHMNVMRISQLEYKTIEKLLDSSIPLLFLLNDNSSSIDDADCEKRLAKERQIVEQTEKRLLEIQRIGIVLFAHDTEEIQPLLNRLQQDQLIRGEGYWNRSLTPYIGLYSQISVSPVKVESIQGFNVVGWIPGSSESSDVVALVSFSDAFSAVPALANGVRTNMSGIIALMGVSKIIQQAYSSLDQRGSLNFLLISADSASLDYKGIDNWLSKAKPELLHSLRYVLCLDTLTSKELVLITPKDYSDSHPVAASILNGLQRHSTANSVNFSVMKRKVSLANPFRPLNPHDLFTKAKLVGGTLTANSQALHLWNRSSLADNALCTSERKVLNQWINTVAKSLIGAAYSKKVDLNSEKLQTKEIDDLISKWIDIAKTYPRSIAIDAKVDTNRKQVSAMISNEYERMGIKSEIQDFEIRSPGLIFYQIPQLSLAAIEVHPTLCYLLVLIVSTGVSGLIYVWLRGWKNIMMV